MKKTGLLNSFFLIPGREIVKNLAAFFRFTEADGCTLVSAYGLQVLKVDHLQNNPANEQKETGESSGSYLTNSERMAREEDTGLQFQDPAIRQKRSFSPSWMHSRKRSIGRRCSPIWLCGFSAVESLHGGEWPNLAKRAACAGGDSYFTVEKAVGFKKALLNELMSGPFFSVSLRFSSHSGSAKKAVHFCSRSVIESQANR